jgi:NTE family protein
MNLGRFASPIVVALLAMLGGCATRPINPPIEQVDLAKGYRYETRWQHRGDYDKENVVILAFSGGGTRAAAFSYGVLEALRRMQLILPSGRKIRMLDEVDVITGVSGGSFTALAYGLYGDKLFDIYETSFLKRDVQGELVARALSPGNWGALLSETWGRSELAAQFYDEILFHGATYADLDRGSGPLILASATDISTGARLGFIQQAFDFLCSDLDAVPLSRAAAASSAVPFALSPVTFNNYGGSCKFVAPSWTEVFADPAAAPRPAARMLKHLQELQAYQEGGQRPYIHLVDGGLADNLGMRAALELVDGVEAIRLIGRPTPLDFARTITFIIVNSRSAPKTNWDEVERSPGDVALLIKATGVPIDHFSYEAVEQLRDTIARWQTMRRIRDSAALPGNYDPELAQLANAPNIDLYAIDVAFDALKDKAEFEYLNNLPTSFVLPPEAVDRLRAAAATIFLSSPELQRLLKDVGAKLMVEPAPAGGPASMH